MILTYDEWLSAPNPPCGTDEIVRGELRLVPVRLYPHAEVIADFLHCFRDAPEEIAEFGSGIGLMISREPLTCRTPDGVVYWRKTMVVRDGLHWSPPELIVEVLSSAEPLARKMEKLADYASIGVPEVWIISPEAATVEVHLLRDGKLERTAILAEGVLSPSQFPQVSIDIPVLFPE